MNCKLCDIISNKEKHNIAYETNSYIVKICDDTNIPILILKEHKEFVGEDEAYKMLIEFGNFSEYHFGTRKLTINRKQSSHYKHLIWIASQIDHKLETYPGFLEQWNGE